MTGDNKQRKKLNLITEQEKRLETLSEKLTPMVKFNQNILESFYNDNARIIQQTIDISPFIIKSLMPAVEQYQKIVELLRPQLEFWQDWAEKNKNILQRFSEIALDTSNNEFLLENGWIITPYLLSKDIKEQLDNAMMVRSKNREINAIYKNFFSSNNYQELELMVMSWKNKKYLKPRMKVFSDCIGILKIVRDNKKNKSINPSILILPVLIAQIDGITSEFARDEGLVLEKAAWKDKKQKKVDKLDCLWDQQCYDSSEINVLRMLQDFLFSKAFPCGQNNPQNKKFEKPKKVKLRPFFNFSRHKIMHGENYKYGTIDNVLRAFLILDFLANLNYKKKDES